LNFKDIEIAVDRFFENKTLRVLSGIFLLVLGFLAFILGLLHFTLLFFIFGLISITGIPKGILQPETD